MQSYQLSWILFDHWEVGITMDNVGPPKPKSSSVIVISLDQHFVFQNDWDMGHNVQETSVLQSVVKIEVGAGYGSYNNFAMI